MASVEQLERQRHKARKLRTKRVEPRTVYYFHQIDDPYSQLAIQKFDQLKARYTLKFQPYLTSMPPAAYQGSPEHFARWAKQDAINIAADYETVFLPTIEAPTAPAIATANQLLAPHLEQDDFGKMAEKIGTALWNDQLQSAAENTSPAQAALAEGNAKREALGHYQGAMFYFEGEWFWGIDRIRLLEQRLALEGYDSAPGPLCVPEPTARSVTGDHSEVLLEYFPSLRSPYTAIGHQRVLELIRKTGVSVKVRPVMPMMMRGIPAPRAKGRYILSDAAREGRAHGSPLGQIVDPFGDPVKRAFALFPAADAAGRGMEFVTAYLQAAWFDGVDITRQKGLQQVVNNAGLDWQTLNESSQAGDWQAVLESNLDLLTENNLWGVPSFIVSGGNNTSEHDNRPYACWGQDRIWRVANEISNRATDVETN